MKNYVRLTISLDKEIYQGIKNLAEEGDRPISLQIQRLYKFYTVHKNLDEKETLNLESKKSSKKGT